MALPEIDPLPTPPSQTDPANFEDDSEAFVIALTVLVLQINAWSGALPGVIAQAIADAVAAYDPEGAYSADQVDALLAGKATTDLSNVSRADARTKLGTGTAAYRNLTISTSVPSGGSDGDIWFQV